MFKHKKSFIIFLIFSPIILAFIFLIGKFSVLGFVSTIISVLGAIFFFFILRNPFLGLLMVILTLPFERIPTYDIGFFTLKLDQIFAGMTLISWLLKVVLEKKKISTFPIFWPLLIFLFILFISTIYAVDFSRAVSVFVFTIFMAIVCFMVVNLIDSREKLIKVIKWLFVSTIFVSLFGLYQFLGDVVGLPIELTGLKDIYTKAVLGFPRIQAFSMEPLYFANYLFIPLGIAAAIFFFKNKEIVDLKTQIIILLLIATNIILGISRGAYIAGAFFLLFFLIFLSRKTITIKNFFIGTFIIIFITVSAYIFLTISRPDALEKFIEHAQVSDFAKGESVQKRLMDYQKAIIFWQESPIIGIGPGNYGPRYDNYPSHDQVSDFEIVNNQYLETLTENGVLGLFFLILIIFVIFTRSIIAYFKSKDILLKAIMFGLMATLTAILVQYNFFSTLYIMHIWILFALMIAVQNIILNKNSETEKLRNVETL